MNEFPIWFIGLFFGLLLLLAAGRAGYNLGTNKEHRENEKSKAEFRSYFKRAVAQADADRILSRLALDFYCACTDQVSFIGSLPPLDVRDDEALEKNCTGQLQERTEVVRKAKNLFWKAHGWFKGLGYTVKPKSGDYLPGQAE